jgi:S-adenosyl-L-methionine hydrolase (adenosine-forming)
MTPIVTLLTDFGTADGYAAEMKGVLLTRCPGCMVVDVTHDVPPHDVESARLAVARYWRRFPPGTVHLAVVDPGVGSMRASLVVESDGLFLVGPDNGVLSPAFLAGRATAFALPVPPQASPTFHGRDVFAPAAAALAMGAPPSSLGAPYDEPVVLRTREPHRAADGAVVGEVISVDRFGNAVTNCLGLRGGVVEVGGVLLPLQRTYADAAPGALVALVGSTGLIEVAVRDGSASREHGIARGTAVLFRPAAR